MTFKQYIDNPLGRKNAVFSQRDMYKQFYTEKYNKVILREAGNINCILLHNKKKDEYYCYIKIPSEVVPKFYYDVVILFYTENNTYRRASTLSDYDIKVFSNDPSFVFTYLRVFLKNDMFIKDLSAKAPSLALKKDPKEKNPKEIIGYVKSLYFAYLYMKTKNLFNKFFYTNNGIEYNKNTLLSSIEHADIKINSRQEEEIKYKKEKKKDNKKVEIEKNSISKTFSNKPIKTIKPISKKITGNVGKSKQVKQVNKITHKKKI